MAWWVWALITWSTLASVAALCLAVRAAHVGAHAFTEAPDEPLPMPWVPEDAR
jgi:hypothetical protein